MMLDNYPDINVKALRKKLGWTRQELATKMGISLETVERWELGKNQPSPMARKLLKLLIDLMDGEIAEVYCYVTHHIQKGEGS